jgi:GntR family transcriptional regulator
VLGDRVPDRPAFRGGDVPADRRSDHELEREGLVEGKRGMGTFVSRSLAMPQDAADGPLREELVDWVRRAKAGGLGREDVEALVKAALDDQY